MTRLVISVMLALALGQNASAQTLSSLRDHDTDQPIDIAADRVDVRDREDLAIFTGAVRVEQGGLVLSTETLRVYYERIEGADPSILRLDAEGGVVLTSPSETVSGTWGIYDVANALVTVGGAVELTQGETRIAGDRLELDLDTGLARVDGGSSLGRVRGRFAIPENRP